MADVKAIPPSTNVQKDEQGTRKWPENRPLEKVCGPDENDVIFSSADSTLQSNYAGNDCFLSILRSYQQDYVSKNQLERPMVALDIIHKWRNRGGRFLKYDEHTRLWNDVGDKKARQKIVKLFMNASKEEEGQEADSENVLDAPEEDSLPAASRRISTKLNYAREGKLYGRKVEQETLNGIYEQVKHASKHFVLISGESGMGKTALAQSLQSHVKSDGGFLLQAKVEELSSESTAALVSVLSDFLRQLLQCDGETMDRYCDVIKKGLGEEARILTRLVPDLVKLLGHYETTLTVEGGQGSQATKRINFVFQSFLKAISSTEHPLVIVLDDLHWANEASLDVLVSLVLNADGLLLVGTYRDDESINTRALNGMIAQVDASVVNLHRIQLNNLDEGAVRFMLADVLLLESEQLKSFSQLVFSRTQGNVFFIMDLLRSLQDEMLLQFDENTVQWTCDIHMAQVAVDTRTVYDLFKNKICNLPKEVQDTLKIASCFGSRLDPYLLQLIVGANVSPYLNTAAARGLLVFMESSQTFVFAHDGIQQATYSLIADDNKESFHLKIGQKLVAQTGRRRVCEACVCCGTTVDARRPNRDVSRRTGSLGLSLPTNRRASCGTLQL